MRGRMGTPTNILMLLPLITPEIVTGVGLLLIFSQLGTSRSRCTTVMLGHITFSISYVTVIVRARLSLLNTEVEEAAMDLGATRLGGAAARDPARRCARRSLASALLVFVLSFDDFVHLVLHHRQRRRAAAGAHLLAACAFGISPEINAIGTLTMVAISAACSRLLAVPFGCAASAGVTSSTPAEE